MLKKIFPTYKNKNITLYYLLMIFMNGWFILPNWVFYFGQFISVIQIGLIDGLSKIVSIFLEVPSGAFSDLFGKKITLIIGNLFFAISCLIIISSFNFSGLLIGNIVMFIGFSLVSGAKEALLYDSLIDIKQEKNYDEVLGKVNSVSLATTFLSIFIGGWLYKVDPKLTFFAWFVFNIISVGLLFFIKEPKSDTAKFSYNSYFSTLKSGVETIFRKSFRPHIIAVLFLSMFIKSYEGVVRQNMGAFFGFTGETLGYVIALSLIPALIVAFNYKKIKSSLNKKQTERLITFTYLIAFVIAFIANIYAGLVTFLLIYVAQEIAKPFTLSLINKNVESKHRATAISTVSLISEIPYIIIVIGLGQLLELPNLKYLYIIFISLLLMYLLSTNLFNKKNK